MQDEIELNVGIRIRQRRKQLGLRMRELAEKSQLTPGFIGQVERGESTPSIAALIRIAKTLKTSVSSFLDGDMHRQEAALQKSEEQSAVKKENSAQDRKIDLLFRDFSKKMEIIRTRMPPGSYRDVQPLEEPTEQIIYILEGELKIILSSGVHILQSGHFLYYDGNTLQRHEVLSDSWVVFLTIITPPVKKPVSRNYD